MSREEQDDRHPDIEDLELMADTIEKHLDEGGWEWEHFIRNCCANIRTLARSLENEWREHG